jgi:hemerythrin
MFRWNMSLETGIGGVDHGRRALIEAMADFFQILDAPDLNHRLVAERTGAIYKAMKAAFDAEGAVLTEHGDAGESHRLNHAKFLASYVDLCKKLVPSIKGPKQARQACLEIYQLIDTGLYRHLSEEAVGYKARLRHPPDRKTG